MQSKTNINVTSANIKNLLKTCIEQCDNYNIINVKSYSENITIKILRRFEIFPPKNLTKILRHNKNTTTFKYTGEKYSNQIKKPENRTTKKEARKKKHTEVKRRENS